MQKKHSRKNQKTKKPSLTETLCCMLRGVHGQEGIPRLFRRLGFLVFWFLAPPFYVSLVEKARKTKKPKNQLYLEYLLLQCCVHSLFRMLTFAILCPLPDSNAYCCNYVSTPYLECLRLQFCVHSLFRMLTFPILCPLPIQNDDPATECLRFNSVSTPYL